MLAYSPAGRGEERGEREERERREDQPTPSPSLCPKVHNPETDRRQGRCREAGRPTSPPTVGAVAIVCREGARARADAPAALSAPQRPRACGYLYRHPPHAGDPPAGSARWWMLINQLGNFPHQKRTVLQHRCCAGGFFTSWVYDGVYSVELVATNCICCGVCAILRTGYGSKSTTTWRCWSGYRRRG